MCVQVEKRVVGVSVLRDEGGGVYEQNELELEIKEINDLGT